MSCDASSSGLTLQGPPVQLLDHPHVSGNLYTSLVWTGTEHLFFWRIYAGDGIYMRRIDASGHAVGDNVRLRPYENAFDVAWSDRGRLGAAWTVADAGDTRNLMFQSFDSLGNALTEPAMIRSSADINFDGSVTYGPRIASVGEDFVVVWAEKTRVFMAKVDPNGHVQGEPALVADSDNHPYLHIAAARDSVLVGWTRGHATPPGPRSSGMSLVTRAFSRGLVALGDATTLGQDPSFIGGHQLLSTDDGFVALWDAGFPPDGVVQVARLSGAGVIAGSSTMGAPVTGRYRYLSPTVWSRDHLVVLWSRLDGTGLTLSRFTAGGERQGESVEVPAGGQRLDYQWTDRLYVTDHDGSVAFIWSEEGGDSGYRVYFQRAGACD